MNHNRPNSLSPVTSTTAPAIPAALDSALSHAANLAAESIAPSTRRAYAESAAQTLEALREEGKYAILSPQQAADKIASKGSLNLAPLCGGVPIDTGWQSLQLYADKVVPLLEEKGVMQQ